MSAEPTNKITVDDFRKKFENVGNIWIKPFIDPNKKNMGLENYNMVIFPGTIQEEQLAAVERNGVVRFITGLDEFAPEVQNIIDPELRASRIMDIRLTVAYLERALATNVLNVEDELFWNKVKLIKPDNLEFWGRISIRCSNDPIALAPLQDPYDLIKVVALEAGGFSSVAKSFEDALARPIPSKFFLDKEVHTVSNKTEYKRLRNKAIGILDHVANSNVKKLMYILKILASNGTSYKLSTPMEVMYDSVDDYIAGNGVETNKNRAAQTFIDLSQLDIETLKLRAVVKDASFYRIITPKPDGMLYHTSTSAMMGRNVSDAVMYLKNPLHEDILMKVLKEVEGYWAK
jgi:hypothetical protein